MNDEMPSRPGEAAAPSRRRFLARAAGAASLAIPALAVPKAARAAASQRLTGTAAVLIREVMNDEIQHVPIIGNLLVDPDNPLPIKIRHQPTFNFNRLIQPNLMAFLETAAGFENTGSGLYGGALLNITQTTEYFPTAVGLCTVESRHAAWLNSLLGQALVPNFVPVEAPISQEIALSRVAEFVMDPRSTFPSFRTDVVSDANNFAILDFLLFLEWIESAFYEVNVPRFT